MTCPNCKSAVPLGGKFCEKCGTPAPKDVRICGHCKTELAVGSAFCERCGKSYKSTLASQAMCELRISAPFFTRWSGREITLRVTFTDSDICFTRITCKWWKKKHPKKERATIPFRGIREISNRSGFQWGWLILKCAIFGCLGTVAPFGGFVSP